MYVVWHLHAMAVALFIDNKRHVWLPNVPVGELVPVVHIIYVHSIFSVAGT